MSNIADRHGPGEKFVEVAPTVLRAETGGEFRNMLDQVREAARLTCGQIAVKANIARSTAYALVDGNKDAVPNKPGQVLSFVMACNLSPVQVEVVMELLQELADKPKPHNTTVMPRTASDGAPASDTTDLSAFVISPSIEGVTIGSSSVSTTVTGDRNFVGPKKSRRRTDDSSWVSLTQYVLMSQDRTRRALRLLSAFTALFAMFLGFIAYVLTQAEPKVAEQFAVGLGASVGLCVLLILKIIQRGPRR